MKRSVSFSSALSIVRSIHLKWLTVSTMSSTFTDSSAIPIVFVSNIYLVCS